MLKSVDFGCPFLYYAEFLLSSVFLLLAVCNKNKTKIEICLSRAERLAGQTRA